MSILCRLHVRSSLGGHFDTQKGTRVRSGETKSVSTITSRLNSLLQAGFGRGQVNVVGAGPATELRRAGDTEKISSR